MKIQLGIAVLYACPGLTAKEAAEAAREFYGRSALPVMKEKIAAAGGYMKAGIAAFNRWNAAHPRLAHSRKEGE